MEKEQPRIAEGYEDCPISNVHIDAQVGNSGTHRQIYFYCPSEDRERVYWAAVKVFDGYGQRPTYEEGDIFFDRDDLRPLFQPYDKEHIEAGRNYLYTTTPGNDN